MMKDDHLFLIGADEIFRLIAILNDGDTKEALHYLGEIISSKHLTLEDSEDTLIHFE